MGKGRDDKGRFTVGHKESEKWNEEKAKEVFQDAVDMVIRANDVCVELYTNPKTKDKKLFINPREFYLSLEQVVIDLHKKNIIPYSSFYYLINKYPILESYKKQIQASIIATLNTMALTGNANPTAAIWRCKQMGETDRQERDVNLSSDEIIINLKKRK